MRLIDADALLEAIKSLSFPIENYHNVLVIYTHDMADYITNAPTVEKCEPVAVVHRGTAYWKGKEQPEGTKLYTAPPQPQAVKEALEKAARLCDELEDECNKFDRPACGDAIRALIEKE